MQDNPLGAIMRLSMYVGRRFRVDSDSLLWGRRLTHTHVPAGCERVPVTSTDIIKGRLGLNLSTLIHSTPSTLLTSNHVDVSYGGWYGFD
jgi:hypothetical protein